MFNRIQRRTGEYLIATALIGIGGTAASASPDLAVERGAALAEQWCAACHAPGVGNTASDTGPTFQDIARRRSPDYIRGFLSNPHERGQMPKFDVSPSQIEDLVHYLQNLK